MPPAPPLGAAPPPAPTDLVLFVSCVKDKPVSRLPLPGQARRAVVVLGAHRVEGRLVYDEAAVIGLTRAEVEAHRRVYHRAIHEDRYLVQRTRADFDAWQTTQREREKMALETAKAEAAKAQSNGSAAPAGGEEK